MASIFLSFLLLSVLTYSYCQESSKNLCFAEKILGSFCRCSLTEPMFAEIEAEVVCVGNNALAAAVETRKLQKHIVVVSLTVSNSTSETVHRGDLQNFSHIKNLSLNYNKISFIENDAFKDQKYLESLDLSWNELTNLQSHTFEHLLSLKNLSLSNNKIKLIEAKTFSSLYSLLFLDLSNNYISSIESDWFVSQKNLQVLILSHNQIGSVEPSTFSHLTRLEILDLSFNNLKVIPNLAFFRLKSLKFLSLAMNELETLNESAFKGNSMLEKVNLRGNLWICDKKLLPLNDWLKKYEAYKEGAFCIEPPELHNYTLQHGLDILYLELKIDENPTCNKSMCNCTISKDKLVVTVDCSNKGFVRLPGVLPYKTKVLNLYNNNIRSLTIDHIDAAVWSDVSFLYLNNNVIDSLKGLEGSWLLRNLVALHLSNNRLTEIPIHILEQFRGGLLDELYLSGNPWNCDCNTVRFQTWLQDNYRAVRNFEGICCSSDSGMYSGLPIYRLKKSQLCPQQVQLVNYLDILNSLMALTIILIILKLSYDYWLQKRTGKLPRFFSLNLM